MSSPSRQGRWRKKRGNRERRERERERESFDWHTGKLTLAFGSEQSYTPNAEEKEDMGRLLTGWSCKKQSFNVCFFIFLKCGFMS